VEVEDYLEQIPGPSHHCYPDPLIAGTTLNTINTLLASLTLLVLLALSDIAAMEALTNTIALAASAPSSGAPVLR
jgi:hypothetical protein